MIYNKNVEQLITERHAFEPIEFNITASPMPAGGATDAPSSAPTPAATATTPTIATTFAPTAVPTSGPSASPIVAGAPTRAPNTSLPTSAPTILFTLESFLGTITDDGALQVLGSPQNLAFENILTNHPDLDPNVEADQIQILEIYALGTTYYATNGGNWADRTGWTEGGLPCDAASTWFGLTCDDSGRVVQIDLTSNDLMGQLPSEIRVLPSLGMIYTD